MFVNRKDEMGFLKKEYNLSRSSFIVVYGRRRVGKTELIKEFIKDKSSIYFLASEEPTEMQQERIVKKIADHCKERLPQIDDWVEAIDYIGEKLMEKKRILVIDEFPYFVAANKSVPSYFQRLADEYLKDSKSMLILSGSSIGVMESKVLGHKSPLYGRRTGQIDLEPFDFEESRLIIKKDIKECIEANAIFGNIPMYLNFFDNKDSLKNNIIKHILDKKSFLYKEPEFILKQEFREPSKYMAIIEAIAKGHTHLNSISIWTKIEPGTLSKYISNLLKVRLIEREVPVTERHKKSKKSLYNIKDGLFNFWFYFIEPNISDVESDSKRFFESTVSKGIPKFVSKTFEKVCLEFTRKKFDYGAVGRWWRKEEEIDIVGLNKAETRILFAECKWQDNVDGSRLLDELKEKSKHVRWNDKNRTEEFVLFARSFSKKPKEAKCYDLNDLGEFF
ncbi:MAG: ATP-binding protein [Nanoarchaeota archaeon]|nr:ATP-binding protein [Nanoarchaeota archaeon]